MDRIDTTNKSPDLFGAGKHGFRDGNPSGGVYATEFDADWCNGVQEEMLAVIEAAGLTPSAVTLNQILQALPAALASRPEMARSLAANGYQRLPGGLILQWGRGSSITGGSGSPQSITFPIAFPAAALKVFVSEYEPSTNQSVTQVQVLKAQGISATGFSVYRDATNSSAVAVQPEWLAIGY